jgi:hypothetical protein
MTQTPAVGSVCILLLVAILFCTAAVPASAGSQGGSRQSAELRFVEHQPGVPSALTLSIDYVNPDDASAKPRAVRRVVEELAAGAGIDTSIPEQCTATDAELTLMGPEACPPGSRVGDGSIRIDSGFPGPGRFIDADVVFLNNADELIFVSTERDSGARVVTRSTIRGRRIINNAPPLPGSPPDGGAIDEVEVELDEIARNVRGARHGYITTPGACPSNEAWTNAVSFTYADGVSQTVETQSPCSLRGNFAFGKVKKLKRKGKARVFVNVGGPGIVELDAADAGDVAVAETKRRRKRATGAGSVRLNVTATGTKKLKLKKKGRAKVEVAVAFAPDGGEPSTKTRRLKLIKRR